MCMRIVWVVVFCAVIIGIAAFFGHCDDVKYESFGRRDPFVPLVGSERPAYSGLENITSADDVKLEGIAISSGGKPKAILNGEIVKENQKIGQLEIKKIARKEVVILFSGTEHILALPEEGGNRGGK